MPSKPKRPCSFPNCPELTYRSYCERHQRKIDHQYNKYGRDPETKKRYGRHWKRIRDSYVKQNPLCEECFKEGKMTPVQEVHHIIPLSQGGTHEKTNLMSLCKSCHSRITALEGGRWG